VWWWLKLGKLRGRKFRKLILHQGHFTTAAGQSTSSRKKYIFPSGSHGCFLYCTLGSVEFLDKTVVELRKRLHSLNNSSIMDKFQSRFFWGTLALIVSAAAAHEGDYNPAADLGEFLEIALT
jgi:hypothetical protein